MSVKEEDLSENNFTEKGLENFNLVDFVDEEFYEDGFERKESEDAENLINLLCFKLANEEYAIDIMNVKEIVKLREFTEVPRAPEFITGIISLRGVIVPVFDLRKRLELEAKDYDKNTRIIIAKDESKNWGMIVDSVTQVIRIPKESIEPAPLVISKSIAEFVAGIGKYEHRFMIIVDVKNILDVIL